MRAFTTAFQATALASILASMTFAAETPQFYVTDESKSRGTDTISFTPEQIEKARQAKDSRPADADPEGHWGQPAEGFQLSIRFEKEVFTNGEPILACLTMRNVSDKLLRYQALYYSDDSDFDFVVLRRGARILGKHDPNGNSMAERLKGLRGGSTTFYRSPAGTQRKFVVDLKGVFDLATNGEYCVFAKRRIFTLDGTNETNVVSGKAVFHVVAPEKP